MREFGIEMRKRGRVFGFTVATVLLVLAVDSLVDNDITNIAWVFTVILASSGLAGYAVFVVFDIVAGEGDPLLRMSTLSSSEKFVLVAAPLILGMAATGVVTVLGYLIGTDGAPPASAKVIAFTVFSKIASAGAWVGSAWLVSAAVRRLPGTSMRIAAAGVGLAVLIGAQIALVWSVYDLGGQGWSLGASTEFAGLPVYANVLAVDVAGTGATVPAAAVGSLAINIALLAAALGYTRIRDLRGSRIGAIAALAN